MKFGPLCVGEFALGQKELQKGQKELQEGQKRLQAGQRELQESRRELRESQKEADRQLRELARASEKRTRELEELFTGQWGKLIESLVEGDLVNLLKNRKIAVEKTMTRVESKKKDGSSYEYDILAVNGNEVVAVEVKTTLRVKDVEYFLKKLKVFRKVFPEYKDKKIYGALAYLKANAHADKYSEKEGLFVIRATGSSASMTNHKDFAPKSF